jgi:hypothetical protein
MSELSQTPPEQEQPQRSEGDKTGGAPVFVYLAILFAAAFLLLLMAYLMQEQKSSTVIADLQQTLDVSRDTLTDENRTLRQELEQLLLQSEQMQEQLDETEKRYLNLQETALLQAQLYQSVLLLEQLEYLCREERLDEARTLLARSEGLAGLLEQADRTTASEDVLLAAGQPGLMQRLDAVRGLLEVQPPA